MKAVRAGDGERGTGNVKAFPEACPGAWSRTSTACSLGAGDRPHVPRSPLPVPRSQNGFTLLEVIAAIMLLAIAFTALLRVAGGSIRLSQNASNHSEAALWARSLLDTAFTTAPIRSGITSGQFDQRFRWRLDVSPWQPPAAPPNTPLRLYQVDLDVMWGPPVHPYSAHFRTLRLASATPAGDNGQGLP